nr:MAG TPA: hypothetical protein [Caudoviricetes sp.]
MNKNSSRISASKSCYSSTNTHILLLSPAFAPAQKIFFCIKRTPIISDRCSDYRYAILSHHLFLYIFLIQIISFKNINKKRGRTPL